MKKIVLIDGHSIINRAFYGVPELTNSKGLHTNAIYGFLNIMFKIIEEEQPDHMSVAFDVKHPTFRHEKYPEYKGTRKPMPPELHEQVPVLKDVLKAMDITTVERPGYEADDIIGTIARNAEKEGYDVTIVSGDRDLLQLVTDKVMLRIPKTRGGKTVVENYDPALVMETYHITPAQITDLKGLMGDSSDNIPGLPGVGEKTATNLLVEYGTVENVIAHRDEVTAKKPREALFEHADLAVLSKELATIKTDCELDYNIEDATLDNIYNEEACEKIRILEFKSMLERFSANMKSGASETSDEKEKAMEIVTAVESGEIKEACDKILAGLKKDDNGDNSSAGINIGESVLALAIEVKNLDKIEESDGGETGGQSEMPMFASAEESDLPLFAYAKESAEAYVKVAAYIGKSISGNNNNNSASGCDNLVTYFVLKSRKDIQTVGDMIKQALTCTKVFMFDVKSAIGVFGLEYSENIGDAGIAAYLLNPLKESYDAADLALEYLNERYQIYDDEHRKEALCEDCMIIGKSYDVLFKKLEETGMYDLYKDIEMPLVFSLYDMEQVGIRANKEELKAYGEGLVSRIAELEEIIYTLAGEQFNINSPKQLGVILFDKLKLPYAKKTKTGYSTSAEILEKLKNEDPIVSSVLEYRHLTKLKSTYADGLAEYISDDGRIHGKFNQTVTATGRISSTEPNLQNIPVRMELGRKIRKVFVPEDGCIFLDADYSQIELRVLAHMSGDESLIQAYNEGQDIHSMTASKVFHVPVSEVTSELRRKAKAVNFGIVYGISAFGLSQDLNIPKKEADDYIKRYFETYPKIKSFLDGLVESAKEKGYSVTEYGRRRPIPELASSNFMQRSFGERVAMNAPIQGTAADIMKIAMINVDRRLRAEKLKTRIVLQVHDELLLEVPSDEEEAAAKVLKEEMVNAAHLSVAMSVDVQKGKDWYEAK